MKVLKLIIQQPQIALRLHRHKKLARESGKVALLLLFVSGCQTQPDPGAYKRYKSIMEDQIGQTHMLRLETIIYKHLDQ